MRNPGIFIVLEGGDGSGKTTQARALVRRLRRRGYPCDLFREPGGTPAGEAIRRLLKSGKPLSPVAELLLFNAARALLVEQRLRPALQQGRIVVCDRFTASTVAYQGFGRGLGWEAVDRVNQQATAGLQPTMTIWLDLAPKDGLQRLGIATDRFEGENLAFHRRVREGYLAQARRDPEGWLVLDGTQPARGLSREVWRHVAPLVSAVAPA